MRSSSPTLTQWKAELRRHRGQHPDRVARRELLHHVVEWQVGQDVGVVGEEHLLVLDVGPDAPQPLADRRVEAGVHEVDRPVPDVGGAQLHLAAAQDEVVGRRLGVVEEVVLDVLGAVAEAQDELLVPEVRVVPHDVPDQRPWTDGRHRLRHVRDAVTHPHAVPAAEQDHLHPGAPLVAAGERRLVSWNVSWEGSPRSAQALTASRNTPSHAPPGSYPNGVVLSCTRPKIGAAATSPRVDELIG